MSLLSLCVSFLFVSSIHVQEEVRCCISPVLSSSIRLLLHLNVLHLQFSRELFGVLFISSQSLFLSLSLLLFFFSFSRLFYFLSFHLLLPFFVFIVSFLSDYLHLFTLFIFSYSSSFLFPLFLLRFALTSFTICVLSSRSRLVSLFCAVLRFVVCAIHVLCFLFSPSLFSRHDSVLIFTVYTWKCRAFCPFLSCIVPGGGRTRGREGFITREEERQVVGRENKRGGEKTYQREREGERVERWPAWIENFKLSSYSINDLESYCLRVIGSLLVYLLCVFVDLLLVLSQCNPLCCWNYCVSRAIEFKSHENFENTWVKGFSFLLRSLLAYFYMCFMFVCFFISFY